MQKYVLHELCGVIWMYWGTITTVESRVIYMAQLISTKYAQKWVSRFFFSFFFIRKSYLCVNPKKYKCQTRIAEVQYIHVNFCWMHFSSSLSGEINSSFSIIFFPNFLLNKSRCEENFSSPFSYYGIQYYSDEEGYGHYVYASKPVEVIMKCPSS